MADDDDAPQDDGAFFKALQSDVEDSVSLALLMEVYDSNDMWSGQPRTRPHGAAD
jgi:hypothetical protein